MVVSDGEEVGVAATDDVGTLGDGLGETPVPQPARSTATTRTAVPREARSPCRSGCIVISRILGTLAGVVDTRVPSM
jgi:hypothetical protein